jgi:hypothetical protein
MALTYDQISAITLKKYIPKLYDAIFDSNPMLMRLKKKSYQKIDGGTSIMVPLNYALPTSAGWYAGADTLTTTDNDQMTSAEYQWKQLYTNISIQRSDELKNSGDAQILNFVKSKVKIAEKNMLDLLGTGVFSNATDPKSIVGLRQIVGTANTVGGISQTTYTWWAAQVDSTSTVMSLPVLQAKYNAAMVDSDKPTVGVTTRTLYNSYQALLQPQQRFTDAETANAGFANLLYHGAPIVSDSHCPASQFYFLNENYLHLFVHKDEDMRFEPFAKPVNQNVKVAKIYWFGALGSSNCRLQAGFTALTS